MAANEFARALPRILVYEGGKVDDPNDPGGRTAYGVTQGVFNAFLREQGQPTRDVFTITVDERTDIYETLYWNKDCGDLLPMGLGFCVFDASVNSGVGQAVKWLQASLGSAYDGEVDGQMGNKTIQAVEDHGDASTLIEEYCARRLGTLKRLRTWPRYGKGWSARISNVQKIADSWTDNPVPSLAPQIDPVDVTTSGGHAKAQVTDNIQQPPFSQIAAHAATAAGSVGTVASQAATQITPVADTFGWIKYVCGGLTILAVIAGVLVKIASDANEAARKGTATASVDPDADGTFAPVKVVEAPTTPPAPAAKAA